MHVYILSLHEFLANISSGHCLEFLITTGSISQENYVAGLGFKFATPGSAVSLANCNM